ncbi:AP2 domain transcription factor AP2IX-7, putative [Babesia ovis]|uniref:AP2 domain transcription factor AP2IX-7, putative n=1 Tax=Babesia ovis TaxID=5869 RepID=A0A9W5TCB3_BABOV|nr:AP2 domain transcription factor AP2IX-7, putative [Babesia ovis]
MAFDHLESPAGTELNSRCQRTMSLEEDINDLDDSDGSDSDTSAYSNRSYSDDNSSGGYHSDDVVNDLSDHCDVGISADLEPSTYSRESLKPIKIKTLKDVECEETLRRLHTLAVGDNIYFRRSLLAVCMDSSTTGGDGYVEGKVTCFSYTSQKGYVVVTLEGFGLLKFSLGDLYNMSVDHNIHLQRMQHPSAAIKAMRQKRQLFEIQDECLTRRSWSGGHMGMLNGDLDNLSSSEGIFNFNYRETVSSPSNCVTESTDVRSRPVPPGVEAFCKCRFANKVDLVRKLRVIIAEDKNHFLEQTEEMQELRLILSQNVRAYELEMVAYLLGEDPWSYAVNPEDRPNSDQIQDIMEQYSAAARNPDYVSLYEQWQDYQNSHKSKPKLNNSASI